MTSRSILISEIRIPVERVTGLTANQRYSYYLLGHVFNEMMSLQKMIGFAIPKHDDVRPARRSAEIAQLLFLFRLAASKIYEFQASVNRKEFRVALDELVFSKSPQHRDLLRDLNKAVGGATWLSRMRNGMGFHYPMFTEWEAYTTPDSTWVDDLVYVGQESGNTFYDASASVAMHWMFDKYRDIEPAKAFDRLADELIELIKQINSFAETMVGTIITNLVPDGDAKPIGRFIAPEHDKVSLPYWTHLASMKHRKEKS